MPNFFFNICPCCNDDHFFYLDKVDNGMVKVEKPKETYVVQCNNCGMFYCNPLPEWNESDFYELYSSEYFPQEQFSDIIDAKCRSKREKARIYNAQRRYSYVKKYLNDSIKDNNYKILEFGAGIQPWFSLLLAKKGYKVSIQEPSKSFALVLKQKYNFNIIEESFTSISAEHNSTYRLIFSDSVMEHVHNPVDYMKKCADLLEPGGVYFFTTPAINSFKDIVYNCIRKMIGTNKKYANISPYVEPYHVIGFSKKSLQIMAEKAGLKLVRSVRCHDGEYWKIWEDKKFNIFVIPLVIFCSFILWFADKLGLGTNRELIFQK